MIANKRQYGITKAQAEKFKLALEAFNENDALADGLDPLIVRAQKASLESQYEELLEELREYEGLSEGAISEFSEIPFSELPDILIKSRIGKGLGQRELAKRLDIKEQQVQRYEADRFQSASLRRLNEFVQALDLKITFSSKISTEQRIEEIPTADELHEFER